MVGKDLATGQLVLVDFFFHELYSNFSEFPVATPLVLSECMTILERLTEPKLSFTKMEMFQLKLEALITFAHVLAGHSPRSKHMQFPKTTGVVNGVGPTSGFVRLGGSMPPHNFSTNFTRADLQLL